MMDRLSMRRLMNDIKGVLSHKDHAIKIVISTTFKFFPMQWLFRLYSVKGLATLEATSKFNMLVRNIL